MGFLLGRLKIKIATAAPKNISQIMLLTLTGQKENRDKKATLASLKNVG